MGFVAEGVDFNGRFIYYARPVDLMPERCDCGMPDSSKATCMGKFIMAVPEVQIGVSRSNSFGPGDFCSQIAIDQNYFEICVTRSYLRKMILVFAFQKPESLAGLPALQRSEPGQVRKEAAIADVCKCRG